MNPVVDRLEADHTALSDLIDEVESAAQRLGDHDDGTARKRLVNALGSLAGDLLDHLQYEEERISGTLRTWTHWPRT